MIKKYLLLTLAAFLLTACGGSSSKKPLFGEGDAPTSEEQGSGTNDEGQSDSDVSTNTEVENPRLGTGAEATFNSGRLELTVTELSAGGTTKITANIVDRDDSNKKIVSQSYKIVFASTCSESKPAKAEFNNPEVITASGAVSVIYTAKGCSGEDTISANLFAGDELKHTAIGKVNIELAELNSITFVETEHPALSISTIANKVLPELTNVTFKVLDKFNNPISDKEVTFELTNDAGGVELAKNSGLTNNEGIVSATLISGSTHLITEVKASTFANDGVKKLTTSSLPISITTGLPRQDGFSISLNTFNPGSFHVDGVRVEVFVTAADAFGNFVPDGTVVNFTAEAGTMEPYCAIEEGQCTAIWKSGGVRPGQHHPSLNRVNEQIGMTTILAYTLGEAGFTDTTGNNIYEVAGDEGVEVDEAFLSFDEPFRDDNWNGALDTVTVSGHTVNAEIIIDTNSDKKHTAAGNKYQGALCSVKAQAESHCQSLMHVRDQVRFVQTVDSSPLMHVLDCTGGACAPYSLSLDKTNGGEFYVVLQDQNGNMAPAGTELKVTGEGYKTFGDAGIVNNNIGKLQGTNYDRGLTGLPEYGMLYRVEYEPDNTNISVELSAENKEKVTRIRLK